MKQILLSLATMMAVGTAYAQDIDLTPANYKYADRQVGQETIAKFFTGANIPAPCDAFVKESYNNGLFAVAGGQFGNEKQPYAKDLQAGTSIVDLGGEVGKVLCINGANSNYNKTYNTNYPQCTGTLNWFNFDWFMDPNNTPTDGGSADAERNIRVRVVLNIYSNTPDETADIINKAYMVTNQGNVMPASSNEADGKNVTSGEFIETYEDDGTPVEDDNGNYIYDPTKWMVYEWDTYCPEGEDDKLSSPMRLKMEMNQGNLAGCTMFIKEVSFTKLAANTDPISGNARRKTFKKLTVNPQQYVPTAINGINASAANGVKEVYTLDGTRVNAAKTLGQGVYIVKENGKTAKMIIK